MPHALSRLRAPTLAAAVLAAPLAPGVSAPGPQEAAAQDPIPVLERASEVYRGLDGFCADFRQELRVQLLRQTTRSRGELCQRPPGRFEMRFTDPEGDRIVADGTHIWIYFPSTDPGQVFRTRLAAAEGRFDFHREFLSEPAERYRAAHEGVEDVDGRRTHRILLEPRDPSPYVQVRVWIDAEDHLLRRLEIHEEGETVRLLELTNLRLDPVLRAERFVFEPPEGVRVISREAFR
jgi:outer membrane lipoprotein-sorting protein